MSLSSSWSSFQVTRIKCRKTELVTDHEKLMAQRSTWADLVKRLHDYVLKVRFGFKLTNHFNTTLILLSLLYRSLATTHSTGNFKWTTIDKYERDLFTFDMGIEESMILTMMIRFTSCRERIRNPMNRLSIWQRQQRYLMMMMMIRVHLLSVGYCIALTLNSGKLVLFTPASEQSFWCDLYLNWCGN